MLQILAMLSQNTTPNKCTRACLLQYRVLKLHNFSVYGDSIPLNSIATLFTLILSHLFTLMKAYSHLELRQGAILKEE